MNLPISPENLQNEINWFIQCVLTRFSLEEGERGDQEDLSAIEPPDLTSENSAYGEFVNKHQLDYAERLVLMLSLVPHIKPDVMDFFKTPANDARLMETKLPGFFMPTGETALFLLAGKSLAQRIAFYHIFEPDHLFYRKSVLDLANPSEDSSVFTGILKIHKTFLDLFTLNTFRKPKFSPDFPAHLLVSNLDWTDLVLNESTIERLDEVKAFLRYEKALKEEWGLQKHMKPGYRCLFYGPSGTGKSLAATLLGKYVERDVYRIDLSSVVSKYIGDTAKNLNNVFNLAEDKDWILFFDEGDALFAKRIDTSKASSPNAQFANQDVAFLLQRIENYNGLVIVATNFRQNIDQAFSRRFQAIIPFNPPDEHNRLRLWKENLPQNVTLDKGIDLEQLAKVHQFTAASILSVINRVSLLTIQKDSRVITREELDKVIQKEIYK